jgi:hypothetical protein
LEFQRRNKIEEVEIFKRLLFHRLSRTTDTNPGHMTRSLRHPLARTMHTYLTDK